MNVPENYSISGYSSSDLRPTPLTDLISALEHATFTAKHLPSDPSHLLASLRAAHHHISAFLARAPNYPDEVAGDEPMVDRQVVDEEDESRRVSSQYIDEVQDRVRAFAIQQQSKRRKRPLSPSFVPEREGLEGVNDLRPFDSRERMRSLDLVFQFHG